MTIWSNFAIFWLYKTFIIVKRSILREFWYIYIMPGACFFRFFMQKRGPRASCFFMQSCEPRVCWRLMQMRRQYVSRLLVQLHSSCAFRLLASVSPPAIRGGRDNPLFLQVWECPDHDSSSTVYDIWNAGTEKHSWNTKKACHNIGGGCNIYVCLVSQKTDSSHKMHIKNCWYDFLKNEWENNYDKQRS